ncbi:ribosomal protein S18 acetylase RimI-like enzyme [Salirhabdus euzebyi]|uniref:Ribosomal protein S18 acetylase RimI-like enzyme n=1 Tax=Salirhabdus euzebyi TaxID=394506 RepID=A0A841Q464_9BACI|nr:GNAT family N-acetyltransferase [Salirhabdus euzebyi]MBB6453120.1 ribosomal protein S18 acetylase RimI-like enzyme [Salirhabdus euzebyi]
MEKLKCRVVEANQFMLEEINDLYLKCREHLILNGIFQWDDNYPNKEYFQYCISEKILFVLMENEKMLGHVVMNEWESSEWEIISWEEANPIVIHSLMIDPSFQGKGLGKEFVLLCEKMGKKRGYSSIRLDAFSGNKKALYLYKVLGYEERGKVLFGSKPEGSQEYICFEKKL